MIVWDIKKKVKLMITGTDKLDGIAATRHQRARAIKTLGGSSSSYPRKVSKWWRPPSSWCTCRNPPTYAIATGIYVLSIITERQRFQTVFCLCKVLSTGDHRPAIGKTTKALDGHPNAVRPGWLCESAARICQSAEWASITFGIGFPAMECLILKSLIISLFPAAKLCWTSCPAGQTRLLIPGMISSDIWLNDLFW